MPKPKPPRMPFSYIVIAVCMLFFLVVAVYLAFDYFTYIFPAPNDVSYSCMEDDCVLRVIDGDTFDLNNGDRIRLICLDAPEMGKTGSAEARQYLESLVLGREVRLEMDVSDTDKYDRLLRYVYVNSTDENGQSVEIFVNQALVGMGYAEIMRIEPDVKRCGEIGTGLD